MDRLSGFLADRRGLLPILGILLVLFNAILQFIAPLGWLAETNLLLHLGVVTAIFGLMLAWAL